MSNLTDEEWEKWHSDVMSIRALPELDTTPSALGGILVAVAIFSAGYLLGRLVSR